MQKAIITSLVATLLYVLAGQGAFAQKACDQFRASTTLAPSVVTEKVAAITNKKVYICGYIIVPSATGGPFEFELSTGRGTDCATSRSIIIPRMSVPVSGIVNRIPYAAGESAPAGQAVCLQTWGTGPVSSVFYWAQF
jgi:hypothetical protein